jgi:predicted dehydrogenase
MAAFERGWHVLCEKPMATSAAEAGEMVAAAQRHQRLLAVNLYKRFFPAAHYIRGLCRDWLLGPLVSFTIREGGPFRWPAGASFFDRTQTRGGVLFDLGVHVFDLLGWWLGEPADVRYADDAMGGLEANAFVQLTYGNGVQGRVHLSRDWATAQQHRFVFERGIVTWKVGEANAVTMQLAGAPAAVQGTLVAPLPTASIPFEARPLENASQCSVLQLCNILAAIAGQEPLFVPGEEGQHALRLIERCYAHRVLVEQPWLGADEAARAQEFSTALPAAT